MSDDKKLDAQRLLEEMQRNYIAELPTRFNDLEQHVLALDQPPVAPDEYETLYRAVHSLKGTAGTYGLNIISAICHQFEDFLSECFSEGPQTAEAFDLCLQYIDLMRETSQRIQQGRNDFSDIENRLSELKRLTRPGRHSVLLVDGSRTARQLHRTILAPLPVNLSVADSGLAALERLAHEPFELVITGMQLGGLTGAALIAALRLSGGINQHTRTILISASETLELPEAGRPDYLLRRDASLASELQAAVRSALSLGATH